MSEEFDPSGDFFFCLCRLIRYWERQDRPSLEKLEGLTHSILAMCDGVASDYPACIRLIAEFGEAGERHLEEIDGDGDMLHGRFVAVAKKAGLYRSEAIAE